MDVGPLIEAVVRGEAAGWVGLIISTGALLYLRVAESRDFARVSWQVTGGLLLLVLQSVLVILSDGSLLALVPALGRLDLAPGSLMNWGPGIVGLGLLCWGVCRDSTQNLRTVRDLHREARFQEALLSGLEEGVLVLDRDKNVVFINPRALNALEAHYNASVPLGQPADYPVSLPGPALSKTKLGLTSHPRDGAPGRVYAVREKLLEPIDNGEPLLLRTWWDITGWEENQRLSHEFVYAVSHELRTPLTSICGYLELVLGEPELDPLVREHLEIARINGDRLRRVVEDLLYLSQVEGGAVHYRLRALPIVPLVDEAAQSLATEFSAKGIAVCVQAEDSPLWVTVDRERLLQVLANLLSNAVKYTPEGGRVTVRVVAGEDEVRLDVEDTGIGIPPSEQAKVFTRFFRSPEARRLGVSGTGLGLAITKSLVEGMNGSIWFASEPGKGSTFSVSLRRSPPQTADSRYETLPAS